MEPSRYVWRVERRSECSRHWSFQCLHPLLPLPLPEEEQLEKEEEEKEEEEEEEEKEEEEEEAVVAAMVVMRVVMAVVVVVEAIVGMYLSQWTHQVLLLDIYHIHTYCILVCLNPNDSLLSPLLF